MKKKDTDRHHEQIPSVQKTFLFSSQVTDVMEELGNPFADTSTDLYMLDTKRIMPASVMNTILLRSVSMPIPLHSVQNVFSVYKDFNCCH